MLIAIKKSTQFSHVKGQIIIILITIINFVPSI
jgi:hypothetical protein